MVSEWQEDCLYRQAHRGRSLDIYVINPDGSGETNLTRTKASTEAAPSWSPDSKKITYLRGSDPSSKLYTDIYVMNSDGIGQTRLIKARDTKYFEVGFESPAWAPDGEKIAFMRTTRVVPDNSASSSAVPATGPSGLYMMKPDGTCLRKLPKAMSYAQSPLWAPLWSPDGKEIAFSGAGEKGEKEYLVNADGTELSELLPNVQAHISSPSWSPDGKHIAFTRGEVGDFYLDHDIYVMNAVGSRRMPLANKASSPSFAP